MQSSGDTRRAPENPEKGGRVQNDLLDPWLWFFYRDSTGPVIRPQKGVLRNLIDF